MAEQDVTGRLWASDLGFLVPELTLLAAAVLLALLDLALPQRYSRQIIGWLALGGILAALGSVIWWLLELNPSAAAARPPVRLLGDSYRIDDYASVMKLILLGSGAMVLLLGLGSVRSDPQLPDKGEFYTLLLPALLGAMVTVSSGDLITLYVGLELLALTTYVLVGMRKQVSLGAEAGIKYVVIGGISSAVTLFGMSYLYGITGTTHLGQIGMQMAEAAARYEAFAYIGLLFVLGGLAVKLAAAPFHAWAPDVYQGAATPVTALLAVIAKAAVLAALGRIFYNAVVIPAGGLPVGEDMLLALQILAAAAMLIGTLAALQQRNMKRLLALSGVAHAGYLLVPLSVGVAGFQSNNLSELIYYLLAYALMTLGAFGVTSAVAEAAGHEEMSGFAGMYYRSPALALAMTVLLLSLAGLPISGGFFGKLFILFGAAQHHAYWLVAVMLGATVAAYFIYFSILRQMFLRQSDGGGPIRLPVPTAVVIWICVAGTLALGLVPGPVLEWIGSIVTLQGDLLLH
ncbi:NADH-quinone oxidoreductase subunit N [Paenibacillus sp. IB182496]|uniref:NADH-quinone oxidoreductase subunit N n=1 Tax=Paenibacillus sabuli TaxID=2772509 RepID=A0A927BV01_9BACL|nr:NADH-quinone oxidoreductase subunit N [Paenibacillus sabuli]MBD2845873.1 NADH-quinone oxidoreductase subunit N [Paenibacillus sabuli]